MRKNFKILVTVFSLLFLITGISFAAAPGYDAVDHNITPESFQEAPELKEKVDQGELPPVEERLPDNPLVIKPADEIGEYGSTWRRFVRGPGMGQWLQTNHYEPLIRWKTDLSGYAPGLAKDWEFNDDGTVFTLYLREGVKFSDGEPLTTEDFMFWWEDMLLNDDFPDVVPYWLKSGGNPIEINAIDKYTLQFTFSAPNWHFHSQLARGHWRTTSIAAMRPKHYLKQFHPQYNSDKEDMTELEEQVTNSHLNPDYPTLSPWQTIEYQEGQKLTAERNPYYYVVDTEGNQLPYINEVVNRQVPDDEAQVVRTVDGEVDIQFRGYNLNDYSLLKTNEDKGNYNMRLWELGDGGSPMIFINWDHKETKYRELFRNQNFRIALSHAIDRNYINEVVYQGLGNVQNATMSKFLVHYLFHSEGEEAGRKLHEKWAQAYSSYNVDKAKQLLDEAGYVDTDDDGWREFKNGETIHLLIDGDAEDTLSINACSLIAENWEEIGLKTDVNSISGAQMQMRLEESSVMFKTFGYGSQLDLISAPDNVFPIGQTRFHPKTGLYNQTNGKEGFEPVGPMKKLTNIYEEALSLKSPGSHRAILEGIKVHIEEGPFIYTPVANLPAITIIKENVRNVPEFGILGPWSPGFPGTTFPGQYYFKE